MTAPHTKNGERERRLQNRREIMAMRRSGLTFDVIAHAKGVTKQRIHQIVKDELVKLSKEMAGETECLRALEIDRLDRLLAGLWKKAQDGDLDAVDRALKISARRSAMLGLDDPTRFAPIRIEHESVDMSPDELKRELERRGLPTTLFADDAK